MSGTNFSALMGDGLNQTFIVVALVGAASMYFITGLDLHW